MFPAGYYMFKGYNRNARTRSEICPKLTIKTPKHISQIVLSVSILNFEQVTAFWVMQGSDASTKYCTLSVNKIHLLPKIIYLLFLCKMHILFDRISLQGLMKFPHVHFFAPLSLQHLLSISQSPSVPNRRSSEAGNNLAKFNKYSLD